jgi:hypothetical protein
MEQWRWKSGLVIGLVGALVAGAHAQGPVTTPATARPEGTALAVPTPSSQSSVATPGDHTSPAGTPPAPRLGAAGPGNAAAAQTRGSDPRRESSEKTALAAEAQQRRAEVAADILRKAVLIGVLLLLGLTAGLFLWRFSEAVKEGDRPRLESHWGGFGGGLGGWEISSSLAYLLVAAALTFLFVLVAVEGTRPPRVDPPKESVSAPAKTAGGTSSGGAGGLH